MWITIDAGDTAEDVEVSGAGGATASEIAAAIRRELELPEELVLTVERTGAVLHGEAAIDLRDGDIVRAGAGAGAPVTASAVADLVIAGGPAMGRRVPLQPGVISIGRSDRCDVTIDDEALSSVHLRVHVQGLAAFEVEDAGSTNGTFIDARRLAPMEPQSIELGTTIELGRSLLRIDAHAGADARGISEDGKVPFNRPPRVGRGAAPQPVELAAPPPTPDRPRIPLATSILPVIVGVVLWQLTGSIVMLAFTALSPVLAIWNFTEQRHSGKRRFKRERASFLEQVSATATTLASDVDREARERRSAAPDAAELLRRAHVRDPRLWERSPGDDDFLSLRVGISDQPAQVSVTLAPGGDEEMRRGAMESFAPHRMAPSVPLLLSLREHPVIGLCGDRERVESQARWLVAQTAGLHSPRELAIASAIDRNERDSWSWTGWLPHNGAPAGLQEETLVAFGGDAARTLLERLAALIAERAEPVSERSRPAGPAVLALLDERCRLDRSLVSQLLEGARDARISVIWMGSDRRDLPGECDAIVELPRDQSQLLLTLVDAGEQREAGADGISLPIAQELARALAPIRDTSARRAGGELPTQVMLLDLAGLEPVSAGAIIDRWSRSARAPGAPIGATADGTFTFDPRVDGPHALIAGTTGSGKSELLQTLVCSLAATYPPNRMSFLLIDYKGGAAFRECMELPHVVGMVTDLDGHLSQRALTAMNAELLRRERDLTGHKDLVSMQRAQPDLAPARLMIVVDEFATLVKEVPEFIDGVINVALRGRSLGIHLVLATQRPSGVISPQIRANTDLRIALRTSDAVESNDVIDSPLAGRIARNLAGRAFARSGQRLVELQTAYVGAHQSRGERRRVIVRRLAPLELSRYGGGDGHATHDGPSDLHLIVDAIGEAARSERIQPPPSPWLPPLASHLSLEAIDEGNPVGDPTSTPLIGVIDEPALQRQEPFALDLEADGHVLVYGTSGAGKTTFLRTLAASLARRPAPGAVQIYGIDCATRGLGAIERLPQVGSVIPSDDVVRARRLLERVSRIIEERKRDFAAVSASSLAEYRRIQGVSTPRVVILIDDYAGFLTAFERVDNGWLVAALPRLLGEGRPLGVHFVLTAAARNAVPQSLIGLITRRIVLRLASESDYDMVGLGRKTVGDAELPPGRGFLLDGRELQCAVLGDDASGDGQARALAALGDEIRTRSAGHEDAPAIKALGHDISRAQLPNASTPLEAIIGVDEDEEPLTISLAHGHFLIAGPSQSGRSTALATIVRSLAESTPGCELHLFSPRRSSLAELPLWTDISTSREQCDAVVRSITERLSAGTLSANVPTIIVVDGVEDIADVNMPHPLDAIARAGRDAGVRIVIACERQTAPRVFSGWIAEIKKDENGLLLDPDVDVDGQILGTRLPRRSSIAFPPGRGYLVRGGAPTLAQIAHGD
jgi:DNA segregation ATPase FtsK/SpoIIIE, S-DNA-T family